MTGSCGQETLRYCLLDFEVLYFSRYVPSMSKKLWYLSINKVYTVPELRNYNVIVTLIHTHTHVRACAHTRKIMLHTSYRPVAHEIQRGPIIDSQNHRKGSSFKI